MNIKVNWTEQGIYLFTPPLENVNSFPGIFICGPSKSGKSGVVLTLLNCLNPVLKNKIIILVLGGSRERLPVYKALEDNFKMSFMEEFGDDIVDEMKYIFETEGKKYEFLITIFDDFLGLLTIKNKQSIGSLIMYSRHYSNIVILESHTIKSNLLSTLVRKNCDIIIISNKAASDTQVFKEIIFNSGITKEKFNEYTINHSSNNFSFLGFINIPSICDLLLISNNKFIN